MYVYIVDINVNVNVDVDVYLDVNVCIIMSIFQNLCTNVDTCKITKITVFLIKCSHL